VIVGTLVGSLAAGPSPSGAASVGAPVSGSSSPTYTTYEADCTTSAAAGTVAPWVIGLAGTTSPASASASGASFSFSGTSEATFSEAGIANFEASQAATTLWLEWYGVIGSTDGNATGTYSYDSGTVTSQPTGGGHAQKLVWTSGSPTVTGAAGSFPTTIVGDQIAIVPALNGTDDVPNGTTILSVSSDGSSVTMSANATATVTKNGLGGYASGNVVFQAPISTGSVFTTAGGASATGAGVGFTSVSEVDLNYSTGPGNSAEVIFGGAVGDGDSDCIETGWDAKGNPGPPQTGINSDGSGGGKSGAALESTPYFPSGTTTPLVVGGSSPVFPAATSVNFGSAPPPASGPPVANSASINIAVGATITFTLPTTAGSNPITGCSTEGTPTDADLSVTISNSPTPCVATIKDTDTAAVSTPATFQFTATDGTTTSSAATVSVTIGNAPVDQPINVTIIAGNLVLSCAAPTSPPTAPLLTCPTLTLPTITLNGTEQVVTVPANPIYLTDNRGSPTDTWSLVSYMVPTPGNPNQTCVKLADFCNSSQGLHAADANGQIKASLLSLTSLGCHSYAGNNNPDPTVGAGGSYPDGTGSVSLCSATAGQSGGTFELTGSFKISLPSSLYAGTYLGTVEFLTTS